MAEQVNAFTEKIREKTEAPDADLIKKSKLRNLGSS